MITAEDNVREEFLSPAQKNLTLQFSDGTSLTNASIYTETMSLEQSICDENQIRFGAVTSACFKVQIYGTAKRYKGLWVTPTISVTSGSFVLGRFKIESDELSDSREYRSLVAYDALNDVLNKDMSDWYTKLSIPANGMTLKQFRNAFFSNVGITQQAIDLPNDDMIVRRTISTTDAVLSGKKILEGICEVNGCFGAMSYDNKFRYVFIKGNDALYPRNDLYPNDELYPHEGNVCFVSDDDYILGGLVYQEYTSLPIAKVQIHNNKDDVGSIYPANASSTANSYQITDNYLAYGMNDAELTAVAKNFYNTVSKITYTPAKVSMRGRPWHEVGDWVVVDSKRDTLEFPLLHRTMNGITALKDEFEAQGNEKYTYNINGTKRQFEQVRQKTLEVVRTVDIFRQTMTERVDDLEGNVESFKSEITQTAQQIQSTVEAHYSDYTSFKSSITQTANSIESRVTAAENGITTMQSTITQTASQIRQEITNSETNTKAYIDTQVGDMEDELAKISLKVNNGMTGAEIVAAVNKDNTSSVKIKADKIDISGYVTFSDLSTAGKTTINGANITTGTIDASKATITNINASNITTGTLNAELVRAAWNNSTQMAELDASGLSLKNGSQRIIDFTTNGENIYRDGIRLGYIGTSQWQNVQSQKALVFCLDYGYGNYMGWFSRDDPNGLYMNKLMYVQKGFTDTTSTYTGDSLVLGCMLDCRGHNIKNPTISGTLSVKDGDSNYLTVTAEIYAGDRKLVFKNGILVGFT